ncbi:MAG: adenylate/guanylate cyclase domain-containing protein [Ignavibacteriales bacterium]|nr:adenylate/guanylate cyclase domain-containing protein [Ignavibacteriales bacterium]
MFRKIQTRLEFKILLLLVAVLILGFGTYVVITIEEESRALLHQHRLILRNSSETLMAGIRNVMLTGKAPFASEFVNDVRQSLDIDLTIYDRFGREVFLREGEGVDHTVNDATVAEVLLSRHMKSLEMKDGQQNVFSRYEPLVNSPECWRCHDKNEPLRGVLQVAFHPEKISASTKQETQKRLASAIVNFIATAFRTIMVGGHGDRADTLMEGVRSIPGIDAAQVYSKDGFLSFGPEVYEIPDTKIIDVLKPRNAKHVFQDAGKKLRVFVPLDNQQRCQVCHGSKFPMRGVLVVDFQKEKLNEFLKDPQKRFTEVLQWTVFEGFRSIMLVGKANAVRFYLDELRAQAVLNKLRVFDKEGNERFLNPKPRDRSGYYKSIVENKDTVEFAETRADGDEFTVRLSPLPNESRCHSCHGKNHPVRAVVEVAASREVINATIQANKVRSAGIGGATLLLVYLVLRYFMRSVVVRPVQAIEGVAQSIGRGDLSVQADVRSQDEIGNLARRMNEMVLGLRERFHLQKFVSKQTVEAVRRADLSGVKLGGERKLATVFFSDIRGFTAYSEKVQPERVIAMLNHCLSRQSAVVRKYGGDIDKYVGDELVAVFEGKTMVENAVRAAVEIQKDIENNASAEDKDVINIGIGINTGDMVMGAMGSDERMDYTVIGDNVNLGARLCGAAKASQILISESSAGFIKADSEFKLLELEPMTVKGKEAPLKVYEVDWRVS